MPPETNKNFSNQKPKEPMFLNETSFSKTTKVMPHDPSLKTLRTFKGDLEETVLDNKESAVSIISAEVKSVEKEVVKKENNPNFVSEKDIFIPKKSVFTTNLIIFIFSGLMILFGLTIFVLIYKKAPSETSIQKTPSIIVYNQKQDINLTNVKKEDIAGAIASQKEKFQDKKLSVLFMQFLNSNLVIDKQVFLSNFIPSMPDAVVRSSDLYMVGILVLDKNEPFISISIDDYNKVYVSMLKWENLIKKDLELVFGQDVSVSQFKDEVYRNNDLRVVKNNDNKTILVYGFIDKKILIIASNEEVFMTLKDKYINSKLVR